MKNDKKNPPHPMQPVIVDQHGVVRFKRNFIVSYLLDWCASKNGSGGYGHIDTSGSAPDLNQIARMVDNGDFSVEDQEQLAQLIGYSVSGFGELSYVRDETLAAADAAAGKAIEQMQRAKR